MADNQQRRRRREAPATLADALGSHAASAGVQRQQALARAASLLKMKPKIGSSARGGSWHPGGPGTAAPAAAAPTAAAAAPAAVLQPSARRHESGQAPGAEKPQQSGHGGSTHVQSQRLAARAPSNQNQQQRAVSTHSSADGAGQAAGGHSSGRASGHTAGEPAARPAAAGQQQWGGSTDPSSYFAQARSFLQQLAASSNGVRAEALAAAPELLLQKLEGGTEGLPGPMGPKAQQQQQVQANHRPVPHQAGSQRPVLAPSNAQRASARSCSAAASLGAKQQPASQAVWPQPGEVQRQSSKAARQSGSTTRFQPSSMQPRPGQPPRSTGTLLLPGSMLGGSVGGAGGSRGIAGGMQKQQFAGGLGRWGLDEQEEEEEEEQGPSAGLAGVTPLFLKHDLPTEQPRSSPAWLVDEGDAAEDVLFAAAPSDSMGRRQEAAGPQVSSHRAAGEPLGQLGTDEGNELDGLFRTAKRQQLGQQGQQGQLADRWWGTEPEQAHAAGWGSWDSGGSVPTSDSKALQQGGPWQLSPGGQPGGQQLGWSFMGGDEPGLSPQLHQPKRALRHEAGKQQQQQQGLGQLLPAELLPAFLAPSPKVQQGQQQGHGWDAGGLEQLGGGWGAASSGSDDLPAILF